MIESTDRVVRLAKQAIEEHDRGADSLVGAIVGNLAVLSRETPGQRAFYVCRDARDGSVHRLRGYELVRVARAARRDGLSVVMARPWRDQPEAA